MGRLPWPPPLGQPLTSQSPGSPACGDGNAQGGILRLGALASSPFRPPSINQSKNYREFPCAPWRASPAQSNRLVTPIDHQKLKHQSGGVVRAHEPWHRLTRANLPPYRIGNLEGKSG